MNACQHLLLPHAESQERNPVGPPWFLYLPLGSYFCLSSAQMSRGIWKANRVLLWRKKWWPQLAVSCPFLCFTQKPRNQMLMPYTLSWWKYKFYLFFLYLHSTQKRRVSILHVLWLDTENISNIQPIWSLVIWFVSSCIHGWFWLHVFRPDCLLSTHLGTSLKSQPPSNDTMRKYLWVPVA